MCQPSASSAIDPNTLPATISPTIITSVRATTARTRRSLRAWAAPEHVAMFQPLENLGARLGACHLPEITPFGEVDHALPEHVGVQPEHLGR